MKKREQNVGEESTNRNNQDIASDFHLKEKFRRTKIIIFSGIGSILISIIIFAAVVYIRPMMIKEQQYTNAVSLMNHGKYDEALYAFEKVLHYKNADEMIKETHYRYGAELLNNNELDKSLTQFQLIPGYKDNALMIEKVYYQTGLKLMNDKEYLQAVDEFEKITKGNTELFSHAQKNIAECKKKTITIKDIKEENEYLKTHLQYFILTGIKDKIVQAKINSIFENDALNPKLKLESSAKADYDSSKKAGYPFNKYQAISTAKLRFYNNDILSATVLYYQYTGGAHGNSALVNYNFDLRTGDKIKLEQLFPAAFDYKSVIIGEILNQMKTNQDIYYEDAQQKVKELNGEHNYYIEEGNLIIYYGCYELAPYAAGIIEFKIPISKLTFNNDILFK